MKRVFQFRIGEFERDPRSGTADPVVSLGVDQTDGRHVGVLAVFALEEFSEDLDAEFFDSYRRRELHANPAVGRAFNGDHHRGMGNGLFIGVNQGQTQDVESSSASGRWLRHLSYWFLLQ